MHVAHQSRTHRLALAKVGRAISDFNLIEDGDRVMVGLSGGKDSWALIQILDVLRKRAPDRVLARRRQRRFRLRRLPPRHLVRKACAARGWECHIEHTTIGAVMDDILDDGDTPCSLCARLRRGVLYRLADGRRHEDRARPSPMTSSKRCC